MNNACKKCRGGCEGCCSPYIHPSLCRLCRRRNFKAVSWMVRNAQLKRKADTFLFTIESTGCMPTETIVREAIKILKQKSIKFQTEVEKFEQSQI